MTIISTINSTASNDVLVDGAIGVISWSTFSKADITREALAAAFLANDIDPSFLPDPITALDAYKRATGKVKVEYQYRGVTARVLIRDVSTEPEVVTRHIVREEVDSAGKVLRYETVGEALFVRPGASAGTSDGHLRTNLHDHLLDRDEQVMLEAAMLEVQERFRHAVTHYDSNAVRTCVTRQMSALKAIGVRPSGGVYFVHADHAERLNRIKNLVRSLPGDSVFHSLPLIDSDEQRAMLANAFTEQVEGDARKLLEDIASAVDRAGEGPVHGRSINALSERLAELIDHAEEHDRTLQLVSDRARAAIQQATVAVTQLASRGRAAGVAA